MFVIVVIVVVVCVCVCVGGGVSWFVVIVVYLFVRLFVCLFACSFHLYKHKMILRRRQQFSICRSDRLNIFQQATLHYTTLHYTTLYYTILHYTIAAGFPFSRSGGYKKERDGRTERNWCPPNGYG